MINAIQAAMGDYAITVDQEMLKVSTLTYFPLFRLLRRDLLFVPEFDEKD